jgi:osmotically-inducible protein OsmY
MEWSKQHEKHRFRTQGRRHQELKWDTRVNEAEIGVSVTRGVVTLTGTVGSWGRKMAAQDAAHRVNGVLDVANDIRVKPAGSYART